MTGIPLDDRGLLLGDGLFETLLARDGELVLFEAHLARMSGGCSVIGLPAPDVEEARSLCEAAIVSAGLASGRAAVRLTLTAGSGGRGLDRPVSPAPRLLAAAAPAPSPGGSVALRTATVRRNSASPASRLKSLAYLDNVLARRESAPDEALMLNERGEVACAAAANIFWLAEGRLFTPALSCGVLAGVMRAQVLAGAPALGLAVDEVAASPDALTRASGIFLTNSVIGLRTVSRLDGRQVEAAPELSGLAALLAPVS